MNDEIQRKEILEILEKFLESLKKGDCDIFIRRYWYMDSISEISARHGISESRIKSSLYRSKKKTMGKGEAFNMEKDLKH